MSRPYVVLGVRDLAASRRFWEAELGLGVASEFPGQVVVEAGGLEVILDATGDVPPAAGIEVGLPSTAAAIDAAVLRLRPVRGPKDFGGPLGLEAAWRDPDGYLVTLHAGR